MQEKKRIPSRTKKAKGKMKGGSKKTWVAEIINKGMRFGGRDPGSSASVVLMAAESMFDEACYVQQ